MENNNEIINNNTSNDTEPIKKARKPKTEAQKEAQKRYYLKISFILIDLCSLRIIIFSANLAQPPTIGFCMSNQ